VTNGRKLIVRFEKLLECISECFSTWNWKDSFAQSLTDNLVA
jgi:hypothetical protein